MENFRLTRPGDVDLTFEGELLATESSRTNDHQTRWQEVRIYRTASGKWVTENVGRSVRDGERDLPRVSVCETPVQVRDSLRRQLDNPYITDTAYDALQAAIEVDAELAPALDPESI